MLRIGEYTGLVKIYGLTGNIVAEGQSLFGYMPVKLSQGIYIIHTNMGNVKLVTK